MKIRENPKVEPYIVENRNLTIVMIKLSSDRDIDLYPVFFDCRRTVERMKYLHGSDGPSEGRK